MIATLRRALATVTILAALMLTTALPGHATEAPTNRGPDSDEASIPCAMLDALCDVADAATSTVTTAVGHTASIGEDLTPASFNPLGGLGGIVADATSTAFTNMMLSVWSAGLYVLGLVLTLCGMFLTPDVSGDGPGKAVYEMTLWLAVTMVLIVAMFQLGVTALRRDAKSLAVVLKGTAGFVAVCAVWFSYCALLIKACGELTEALMVRLLKVDTWAEWDPFAGMSAQSITDPAVATVLGILGLFLWLAGLGHFLVYLGRAAALLVLVATGPLAAAGLAADSSSSWFWKSLRWTHAAALTPVLMVIVLGIGVQLSNGVAAGLADGAMASIGTALASVTILMISAVAPVALFKLLAFVDPGTPSGASFRQGMAGMSGLQGAVASGSSAAATTDANGRSSGEASAEADTGARTAQAASTGLAALGPAGAAVGAGLSMFMRAGAQATSLVTDVTNQSGVGTSNYGPDFGSVRPGGSAAPTHPGVRDADSNGGDGGGDDGGSGAGTPAVSPPSPPAPGGAAAGAAAPAASGAAGGSGGAAAAAAAAL